LCQTGAVVVLVEKGLWYTIDDRLSNLDSHLLHYLVLTKYAPYLH